ncbi:MAG: aquaporin [Anaerolineae bacterium]|nr:aquaporin [Anaerolineae bacterium]
MSDRLLRESIAEFIGTFMLVLVGAGAVTVMGQQATKVAADVVVAALAHGLILVAVIATFGHISGAHVNPAVTLGLLIGGKVSVNKAIFYWIAQILGGIAAGFVLRYLFENAVTLGNTVPSSADIHSGKIIILEALGTFFLVSTVFQAAAYGKAGNVAILAIPFTLAAGILFAGPLTGGSFNVARTLGPAIATGNYTEVASYLVGILGGGALAGVLHSSYFSSEEPSATSTTHQPPTKRRK